MKKTITIICLFLIYIAMGNEFALSEEDYSKVIYRDQSTPYPTHGNTIADILESRGISKETIDHLRFIGDESSYTSGKEYIERDISGIWDMFFMPAEPYKFWEASGNRTVEIYLKGSKKSAGVLYVNATDSTTLNGYDLSYMCHGFHEHILKCLKSTKD